MKIESTEIEVIVKEKGYTLTLNEEEALTLAFIVGNVGGNHEFRKKLVDPLYDKLVKKFDDKYEDFAKLYRDDVDTVMYLKSSKSLDMADIVV